MAEFYRDLCQRKVVLDTETTGKNEDGTPGDHRIIEIGCVEMIDRKLTGRKLQLYMNPDRPVDEEAYQVHKISDEFLAGQPHFRDIFQEFYDFIAGAELIIHNARFDVGFIDNEFKLNNNNLKVENICTVTDTLDIAKKKYPGQRISLDALCAKLNVDSSARTSHGALLDAEILAEVFLAMTGGQGEIEFSESQGGVRSSGSRVSREAVIGEQRPQVIYPDVDEEGDDLIYQMKLKKIELPNAPKKISQADCLTSLLCNFFGAEKFACYQQMKADVMMDELDKRSALNEVYKRVQQAKVNRDKNKKK